MKKFITTIPLQHKLSEVEYEVMGNKKLSLEGSTGFPIMYAINGYMEEGNDGCIIAIYQEKMGAANNLIKFKEEIKELERKKNIHLNVKVISLDKKEDTDKHKKLFRSIIDLIDDGDEISACITYGTKPTSYVELMALNYAYRIKKNCDIDAVVYGSFNHDPDTNKQEAILYSIKSLFYMDEIVHQISKLDLKNPEEKLDMIP